MPVPLALFALGLAAATQISVREVACPLGGRVKVHERVAANTHGGHDSDLCAYSSQGQFRAFAVATCPDNLLSLYAADMQRPLDPALRPAIEAALATARAALSDPADPPVWERYALAAAVYRAMGRPPLFLAQLYLEASWTARDHGVGYYAGLEGPVATRALLDAGKKELDKPLTPAQRKTVLYNLARVAHRGGYNAERDQMLAAFEKVGPMDAAETEAVARLRAVAHRIEPVYQELAIAALHEALARPLPDAERARALYLQADLLRRRGRDGEALPLYDRVLAEAGAPPELQAMARALSDELRRR
jgi:tetratricopeptide (TPR) repeat protein